MRVRMMRPEGQLTHQFSVGKRKRTSSLPLTLHRSRVVCEPSVYCSFGWLAEKREPRSNCLGECCILSLGDLLSSLPFLLFYSGGYSRRVCLDSPVLDCLALLFGFRFSPLLLMQPTPFLLLLETQFN